MVDLSIIIVNRNDAGYLEDCLRSVHASTHKTSFEIIFVDNASTDNSVETVRNKFPEVKIIKNEHNSGFCRANNQGLKIYQGRYALLLNTDTIVKNGAFDRMVEFMDARPDAGACGPKLINTDGTPQHQGGLLARKFWLSKAPTKVDFVIGACLLVRREVIEKVGVLDENFFFANDDLDWCRRIRKAGWSIYFLPQAEVVHYGGFTTRRFNRKIFVEGFRGGLYFAKKHYGNLVYSAYRLLLIVFILPAAVFNPLRIGAFFDVFLMALKGDILAKYEKNSLPD